MNRLLHWLVIGMFILPIFACGGGGGGGTGTGPGTAPTPPLLLTGTLTDHTQDGVGGASVTVTDGTGALLASTLTNGAGGYSFDETQLPTGTPLILTFDSSVLGYFPVRAQTFLFNGKIAVLDMVLPSTRDRTSGQMHVDTITVNDVDTGDTATSGTFIDAGEFATLDVPFASLMSGGTPYVGDATVYITPIDVGALSNGFAPYQVVLPLDLGDTYPDPAAPLQLLEVFAAAALEVYEPLGGTMLDIDELTPALLTMPIPNDPPELRANAPATLPLWRYDEANNHLVEVGTATLDGLLSVYTADVSMPGIYVAGQVDPIPGTPINGTLVFDDALNTPAAGITVFITGTGGGAYQQITTTAADGTFSGLVKTDGSFNLDFVAWGNGVQLTHQEQVLVAADLPAPIIMDQISGTPSNTTIMLNGDPLNPLPTVIGFLPGSGRIYVEGDGKTTAEIDAITNVADVNFVADIFGVDSLSIQPTATGSQIKLATSTVWGTAPIDLSGAPAVDVMTAHGTARLTFGSVMFAGGDWTVTFSSQFTAL